MAIYEGYYPRLGSKIRCINGGEVFRRVNGEIVSTGIEPNSTDFLYSGEISSMFNHHEITSDNPMNWLGPRLVEVYGKPTTPIPQKLLEGPVIKISNKDFNSRKRKGEMVVSDYQRIQAMLTYNNGGVPDIMSSAVLACSTNNLLAPFVRPRLGNGLDYQSWSHAPERESLWAPTLHMPADYLRVSDDLTPYDVGWDDSIISKWLQNIEFPDQIYQLATKNTSDANKATVDILTSLAELPETAASILKGIMALKRLFVDAKAKKFSLLNKHRRLETSILARISRVEYDSQQEYIAALNSRRRALVLKRKKERLRQLRADLKKSAEDLTSGIAQVELTVRYGILPVKYTIDGFVDMYLQLDYEYKRWSTRGSDILTMPDVPGFTKTGDVNVTLRAFIKRRFEMFDDMFKYLKDLSASLIVTAYELIPLSFVLDWIVNVGDVLTAFFGSPMSGFDQAATISLKVDGGRVTYKHDTSTVSVDVDVKGYMRFVIDPRAYCRFVFAPDVTGYRVYDALALTWQLFAKKLIPTLK